jgi:hypothetical protein
MGLLLAHSRFPREFVNEAPADSPHGSRISMFQK